MKFVRPVVCSLFLLCLAPVAPSYAQQTGAINGKVTATDGSLLPGVTVEARSDVLPTARVTTTGSAGEYRLPALPPGDYTVTFTLSGMTTVTRQARVQLGEDTVADATLGVQGVEETVQVTATVSMIDKASAAIKSDLSSDQIRSLPVGQEYRDLIKLLPGIQYTQETTRGPSAGGSGQENVYQFDGVNVTLPLFGTLSAEPAAHDIAQVTTIRGGARAVDFDRSGGFSVDSVSKSGTNRLAGQLSYQLQNNSMAASPTGTLSQYNQDRSWVTINGGGPVLPNHLFFYGSYYRPQRSRDNRANLYGDLPAYDSTRNEGFGKLTYTPVSAVLVNASYRDSHRLDKSALFAQDASATTGTGNEAWLHILTTDGSWVINSRSVANFKYTHFGNETQGRPDNISAATINTALGTKIDVGTLDTLGLLTVPTPFAGDAAYNSFIQPIINRYGYVQNGAPTGGGTVGFGTQFDKDNFFRDAAQVGYNLTLGSTFSHEIHAGYQKYIDSEDLTRSSNGWGSISVPGGRIFANGTPIFYQAAYQQQTTGAVPTIHSEYRSQSFEINDTMRWKNWSFNAGLLGSQDTLYGQGLREDATTLSGYVLAPGNKYKMYVLPLSKMLQPRLGATYAYDGTNTVYGSYAKYNPAASSLPRAASWDRNLAATIQANFDANGVLFNNTPLAGSSGKLFVPDLTPHAINEFLLGTARQFNSEWSARVYARYRSGSHFWEDTNNNARQIFNPPAGIPRDLYLPNLAAQTAQITSGSSYVITELDGAYTKYYEATVESDWRHQKMYVHASYTWSRYYGNFDQDNSAAVNDSNIFIGSSNIGDGAGRQLWDNKDGTLRGDRPNMVKLFGYYALGWNATVGALAVAQSGQPWEEWSYEPFRSLTSNTSDTARYAERAGSRRSPGHAQLDLNYTQNFKLQGRFNLQVSADLFNMFNSQTGYNYDPSIHSSLFGTPRLYFDPRVLQLAARLQF
jgi:hypothetical protein